MQPINIEINGKNVGLGSALPADIFSFKVVCIMPVVIPHGDAVRLKQWLNMITKRVSCEYVEYNNILVPADELTKFEL